MADKTLSHEFSSFTDDLHLSDLPESWSSPLKKQYVDQSQYNGQLAKKITVLGVAVYSLQQATEAHNESVIQSAEAVDELGRTVQQLRKQLDEIQRQLLALMGGGSWD